MKRKSYEIPTAAQLEQELNRLEYRQLFRNKMRSTLSILALVASMAILLSTFCLPVLQIYGSSMTPALVEDDIVVSVKKQKYEYGDIIAFYYNNKILIKRVIATAGEWVELDKEGNLYLNGQKTEEPYVKDKSLGECDIEMPFQVPEGRVFVMGDHRSVSVDSRSTTVGCITDEFIVGKLLYRIWPFSERGFLGR